MPQSDSDEDFASRIGAVDGGNDSQADEGTHGDSSDSGSDIEQMREALRVPGPTADIYELRKAWYFPSCPSTMITDIHFQALSFVQEAYFEMQNEL